MRLLLCAILLPAPLAAQEVPELVQANACVDAAFEKRRYLVTLRMSEADVWRLNGAVFADCGSKLRQHAAMVASRLSLPSERALAMAQANAAARLKNLVFPVQTQLLRDEQKRQADAQNR